MTKKFPVWAMGAASAVFLETLFIQKETPYVLCTQFNNATPNYNNNLFYASHDV